jgi:hypothetical protein
MPRYCVGPAMAADWGEDDVPVRVSRGPARRASGYFAPYWRRGLLLVAADLGAALGGSLGGVADSYMTTVISEGIVLMIRTPTAANTTSNAAVNWCPVPNGTASFGTARAHR